MAKLPQRVNRLAKQLGFPTPEAVIEAFEKDAGLAADVLVDVLDNIIAQINANSRSNVLGGYKAVKEKISKKTIVRLAKSGIDLSGNYEYLVYVKSGHSKKVNIFDRIDEGRPELPWREKPYALWSAALRRDAETKKRRINVPFPSNARVSQQGDAIAGQYPLGPDQVSASRQARGKRGKGRPMVFSRGPLAAIPAKNLYERALARAKDRLAVKGLSQYFEVIITPNRLKKGASE